jgi:uncharacterized membrane protein YphA (DoxX/SURF4 family)
MRTCQSILHTPSEAGKYEKIINTTKTANYLQRKLPMLPTNICVFGIILVIILEVFGSLFLLYSAYTDKYKKEAYYTVIVFILFNIVVTFLFHNPLEKNELLNFMKNLSITGGFILLLDRFN